MVSVSTSWWQLADDWSRRLKEAIGDCWGVGLAVAEVVVVERSSCETAKAVRGLGICLWSAGEFRLGGSGWVCQCRRCEFMCG